jgi:hypothetical protein
MEHDVVHSEALREARNRRLELGDALARAEVASAAPGASPRWRQDLALALGMVRGALDRHIDEVEGESGLLAELRRMDPRLAPAVQQLEDEHPALCEAADAALACVASDAPVSEVRAVVARLLSDLSVHRQRGADLVWEAYNVDIGGQ